MANGDAPARAEWCLDGAETVSDFEENSVRAIRADHEYTFTHRSIVLVLLSSGLDGSDIDVMLGGNPKTLRACAHNVGRGVAAAYGVRYARLNGCKGINL